MKTHLDQKALPAESTWRHKHLEDQNFRTTERLLSWWYGWTTPPDPEFGSHVGIVLALAVHLLPSRRQSGTHLGVLHAAIFVALILFPHIGSFILTTFAGGFAALFLLQQGGWRNPSRGHFWEGRSKGKSNGLTSGEELR